MVYILCRTSSVIAGDRPPLPPRHFHSTPPQVDSSGPSSLNQSVISLNEQHIMELTNEGFDANSAARALNLSKNDVKLARDILLEFARP